ncbi:MAG: hypothetical protein HZB38_14090 [Planctomycetes bacterium]|nr:hypothetical protein [Planctomycetota bacterium]
MFRTVLGYIAPVLCVFCCAETAARGDSVTLREKTPFTAVTVTDFRAGVLHFRGVSGETLRKPIEQVERIDITDFPALQQAGELAADGRTDKAIELLAAAGKSAPLDWQRRLARFRCLSTMNQAGRIDDGLPLFLELVREEPGLSPTLLPRDFSPRGSERNREALALLRKTRLKGSPALVSAVESLRLELTLLEEPRSAAREYPQRQPTTRAAAAEDGEEAPLLFGSPRAAATSERVYLPRNSGVRTEAGRMLAAGDVAGASQLIEAALPYVASEDRDAWDLLAGRCRIERKEYARAAETLLALAEATAARDRALNAEALYHVAVAHEGLARPDVAAGIYRELLDREDLPASVRQRAEAAVKRLAGRG